MIAAPTAASGETARGFPRTREVERRLSMNHATVPRWSVEELLEGCARAGYGGAGLWRHRLSDCSTARAAALASRLGIEISSLCRAGWFLVTEDGGLVDRRADNHCAIEEAAELGASVLVVVCGPAPDRNLEAARNGVSEALAELAEYATAFGVTLGIEPMHPIYCGDRSVVVTLRQALALANSAGPGVGVVLDSYHLWWDPELACSVAEAEGSIKGVQLADWLAPPPDPLNGRGMLGDGRIDLAGFVRLIESVGYSGAIEVEIFNPEVWSLDPAEALQIISERYRIWATP
jgi:sugar phosphate isomerase/epimerase